MKGEEGRSREAEGRAELMYRSFFVRKGHFGIHSYLAWNLVLIIAQWYGFFLGKGGRGRHQKKSNPSRPLFKEAQSELSLGIFMCPREGWG